MELLATITNTDFGFKIKSSEKICKTRQAARAVIINSFNQVALLYTSTHGHHKLPGGGIEDREDWKDALNREAMEEAGCTIKNIQPFGKIIEEKSDETQTSFCAIAYLDKNLNTPNLTKDELKVGYTSALWIDFNDAIKLMRDDKPKTYVGKFMHKRDLIFLEHAKKIIDQGL